MQVAVIGAGIAGVTVAHELAAQGHEVSVLERNSSVATGASFGHAGIVAPALAGPWASPGLLWRLLLPQGRQLGSVRFGKAALAQWPWLWRALLASRTRVHEANRQALQRLALQGRDRMLELTQARGLDYEQSDGVLVLLHTERALKAQRAHLGALAELGIASELVDAARAREIEPMLNPAADLRAALHLPRDAVGNGRQFAHQMKAEAVRQGARFHFDTPVLAIRPGARPELVRADGSATRVDAVVVCTGVDAQALLAPLGLALPLVPIWGVAVTAPVNHVEGQLPQAPRAAVVDLQQQVSISRLGQRIRVSGGIEVGGTRAQPDQGTLRRLYQALEHWFPGGGVMREAQHWKGARPTLPDGLPMLGASGLPGVWLNLGHAGHGGTLACGAAQVLAELLAGRDPGLDLARLAPSRWR